MATPNEALAQAVVVEIIRQAGGTFDNKTNLFKAFYYAHCFYAESEPGYLTDWPIVRMPNGPGIDGFDVKLLGPLMTRGIIQTDQVNRGGYPGFQYTLSESLRSHPAEDLSEEAVGAIAKAVKHVAGKSANAVSHESHACSRSWRNHQDGQELNIYLDSIPPEEFEARQASLSEIARALESSR